jgi:hypothetical protein
MRKSISRTESRWLRAGLATGAIAAVVIGAATPAYAAAVPVTLSATTGPSAGTNTITATATTAYLSGYTAPGAAFTVPACPATYSTTPVTPTASVGYAPAAVVKKLSNTKAAVTVPPEVVTVGSAATTKYNVCIYGTQTAGSALVGTATYNVAVAPTVSSITPSSGPALGGSTITVTGTGFPTTAGSITATLGGTNLLSITPVSATSFTAVTPAHAAGTNLTLSIGTTAGTLNKTNAYSYTNGIVVGPNTGPNTGPIDVDVQGVGFLAMDFSTTTGATPDSTNAHVYLANGAYNPLIAGAIKTNAEVTECTSVLVIGDTELICSLQLGQTLDTTAAITYSKVAASATTTRTVTDAGIVAAATSNLTSPTAAFTAADVGVGVTGGGLAANAYISAIVSPTVATLSKDGAALTPTVALAPQTVVIGGPRTVASVTTTVTSPGTAISAAALSFFATDAGRAVTGVGIAPGTTIASIASSSTTNGTLSQSATAAGTPTLTIGQFVPVTNDAYTLTVVNNGVVSAQLATTTYQQSIVSSGSTFTVAPY